MARDDDLWEEAVQEENEHRAKLLRLAEPPKKTPKPRSKK